MIKINSPNGEQRWINLDRVTRVSLATDESGDPVLVFCFDQNDQVRIHGTDPENRALIHRIATTLNAAAEAPGGRLAA
ncbi:MAG: hypothetical protein JSR77_06755 [Planctomycetes bacterium]|nr:hypothetical protein [Planctomycetota bacterium]